MSNKKANEHAIPEQGVIGKLLHTFDWGTTSLGSMENWPVSLRTAVNLCFNSRFPMMISWGEDLTMIYNESYSQIIAEKHPSAFGQPAAEVWEDLWDFIGPQFKIVIKEGRSLWFEDQPILLYRNGYYNECYFTFSYSPIYDDHGNIAGVLTIATETTETTINQRHLLMLGKVSNELTGITSIQEIYQASLKLFKGNSYDIPFAALYTIDKTAETATLVGTSGIELPHPSMPPVINFSEAGKIGTRNFLKCVRENQPVPVHDIRSRLGDMPSGNWSVPPEETVLFPVSYAGMKTPYAVIVFGVNPHRRLDDKHIAFFRLLADQLSTNIARILALEEQENIIRNNQENDKLIQVYISELIEARRQSEEKEERLRMAIESTKLGTWDFSPLNGELTWSDECKNIYGLPDNETLSFEMFSEHIHPDDRDFVSSEISKAMDAAGTGNYDITYRILRFDGETRWIHAQGKVYFNTEGQAERFIGTVIDITEQKKAQEELIRSEKLFKSIVLNIPNSLLIVIDNQYRFIAIEGDIVEKMGYDIPDYKGKHPSEVVSPEIYASTKQLYDRMLSGEKFSMEQKGSTGEIFMMHFVPLRNEEEEVYAGLVIALDITEIRQAEEKSAKLAAIVQTSNDAIISKTLDGIITSWNAAAERMFGYTSAEIIGQSILKLIPEERHDEEPRIINELLRTGIINHFETQRITKDKKILDISLTVSLIRDSAGNVMGVSKIARDVTEKRHTERLISENEERMRLAAESADLGTWDLDLSRGDIIVNNIPQKLVEFIRPHRPFERSVFLDMLHPEDRDEVIQAYRLALSEGTLSIEARMLRKDNTVLWARIKGKTIFNEHSEPVRLLGIIMDITEQKKSLIELEESEKRFRNMADHAPVMIWTAGPDLRSTFFNKAWLDFTGSSTQGDQITEGWENYIHPQDAQKLREVLENAFRTQSEFMHEFRMLRHDGDFRWVVSKGIPRHALDHTFIGFIGSCIDIHESRMAKEELEQIITQRTAELKKRNSELQQQKEFVETMFDASIDIMLVYDKDTRFISFNKACEQKYGVKRQEVLGKTLLEVYPFAAGSSGYNDLQRALAGENIHNPKYRSAVTNLWYEDFLIPMKDEEGNIHSVLVIAHDITNNIETAEQMKQINADLIKSNRDLEQFAYIASHDLQEPLRKIQTFSNMLQHHINNEQARDKYIDKITSSAKRMSDLIRAVLNYSRLTITHEEFETVDLNETMEHVKIDFELLIDEKNARIIYDTLPVIKGIPLQLNQLFSNLISNALKFSDREPVVEIKSRRFFAGDVISLSFLDPAKHYVELIVKDNGIGFDEQYVEQVFTIFQRLNDKSTYEGTGIGLALCKKIVDNHHGHISAKSEPGEGTEFFIYLPA